MNANKYYWIKPIFAVTSLIGMYSQMFAQDDVSADEVFELSPFDVQAGDDKGYEAQNTLSGTRLNTAMKDLGITLTTVTEQFWEDTAFSSVNDMLIFTPGAEKSDTQFGDGNARAQYWGDNTVFRGIQTENIVRNYFRTNIPSDTFNATRIEFSRGPNSVLFGVTRDTAGLVNRMTQDAIFANTNLYRNRIDEHGSLRHELNFNRVLVEGKLAVRGAFLKEDQEHWIKPGYQDQNREYYALQYKPIEKLSIKLRIETLDWDRGAVDPSIHRDEVTPWINGGKQGISVAASDDPNSIVYPAGIERLTNQNQYALVQGSDGSAKMMNLRNFAKGARNNLITGAPAALPVDFLPLDFNAFGVAGNQHFKGHNAQAVVQYKVNDKIHLEYAGNTESLDYEFIAGGNNRLFVDANSTLDDGVTPNPDFGNYYAFSQLSFFLDQQRYLRGHRLAGSLSHDFAENDGKAWLGKHDFVAVYEQNTDEFYWDRQRLVNMTPRPGSRANSDTSNNVDNWARIITYVDPVAGTWSGPTDSRDFQRMLNEIPGNDYQWQNQRNNNTVNRTEIDSTLFVWQSRFWNGRIVPTVGWREDNLTQYNKAQPIPFPRAFAREQGYVFDEAGSAPHPDTTNKGIVFHAIENAGPLDYLALFYNESNSFAVQNFGELVDGSSAPAKTGDSQSYGFRFGAFDGKTSGSFTIFDVTANNDTFRNNDINNPMGDLFDLIGRDDLDDANRNDLRSLTSEGWEFQMTANLTENWRLMFGVDHYKTLDTDVAPVTQRLIAENRSSWLADPNALIPDNPNITAQEAFDNMTLALDLLLAEAGGFKNNERRYKSTLLTNYTFSEGPLKGFGVGGNMVWRDKAAIGFPFRNDPELGLVPDVNNPFFGGELFNVSLNASYGRKLLKDRVDWKIQLNLRNIGDEDPFITQRVAPESNPSVGIVSRMSRGNPQTWVLTNTFKW